MELSGSSSMEIRHLLVWECSCGPEGIWKAGGEPLVNVFGLAPSAPPPRVTVCLCWAVGCEGLQVWLHGSWGEPGQPT